MAFERVAGIEQKMPPSLKFFIAIECDTVMGELMFYTERNGSQLETSRVVESEIYKYKESHEDARGCGEERPGRGGYTSRVRIKDQTDRSPDLREMCPIFVFFLKPFFQLTRGLILLLSLFLLP